MDSEPVRRIAAVTLLVRSMPASVDFYRALGLRVVFGGSDEAFTSLRVGDGYVNLQLEPGLRPVAGDWGRVILWVDDVDAAHARAVAAGLDPLSVPADAPWGERYFHIRDPDGHELSLARPL